MTDYHTVNLHRAILDNAYILYPHTPPENFKIIFGFTSNELWYARLLDAYPEDRENGVRGLLPLDEGYFFATPQLAMIALLNLTAQGIERRRQQRAQGGIPDLETFGGLGPQGSRRGAQRSSRTQRPARRGRTDDADEDYHY